jgi:DNA-binding PadR family transcriptional regulator
LLGLLLEGPHHGYDLARRFAPGTALGDVLRLSTSHLYALLARLERDGLVAGTTEESGSRPARHVYHLTDAGREVVLRWMDEPVARPRDVLVDFPLKLYLARRLGSARAAALVARQRDIFTAYLQQLEQATASCGGEDEDVAFMALVREGRIARTRAVLDWLDRCDIAISDQQSAVS